MWYAYNNDRPIVCFTNTGCILVADLRVAHEFIPKKGITFQQIKIYTLQFVLSSQLNIIAFSPYVINGER